MKKTSFENLFDFLPKSKRQASEGLHRGVYPFYKSSNEVTKFVDEFDYPGNCLIFGTGGSPSIHYQADKFSTSTDCIVACPKNNAEISAKYSYLYFRNNMKILEAGFKGAGLKHISKGFISEIKIPLPSLGDQIRIAAVLTRVEKLIAKRKDSIKALDEFLKSTFLEMFGLNNADYKKWNLEHLSSNTEIVSGVTKGKKYKDSVLREVPYMRVANVQDGHLNLTEIKTIEVTENEIQQYSLQKGDLLLTEGGDPDKLGRGAVWNNEIKECIHQNHIFRVRVKDTSINPVFLSALMASKYGKSYFLKAAKQTTGIASINSKQLKAFPLIKTPLPLQNKFAAIVEKVESIKSKYTPNLTELENLYGSLSQRAFKGKLDLSRVPIEPKIVGGSIKRLLK